MSEHSTPAASENQDPPWPTMHPADDYDGSTNETEDGDSGDAADNQPEQRDQHDGRPTPDDPGHAPSQ